jgi:hypothetical protein
MFFIAKTLPRPKAPGEPLLHQNHRLPVTRRELLGAGLASAPALVVGPAWLAAALKPGNAQAALHLVDGLASGECNLTAGANGIGVIVIDLAGGANLVGSEVIVGQKGGQANFLSTAGYGKMGVPGNMVPSAAGFTDASFGLLWHSDGAILRGMKTKATTPATAANTTGAVICGMSQNDTGQNPHNPMYGLATIGARGQLLNLVGNQSSISGGNSAAYMPNPLFQPTTIAVPQDDVALVSTGGAKADPLSVNVDETEAMITGGNAVSTGGEAAFNGTALDQASVQLVAGDGTSNAAQDVALKKQVRCSYVGAAYTADAFGDPANLDPTQDPMITGSSGGTPIFTPTDFQDSDIRKTASVMKLVVSGYAAAGTITLGGYDYHDSTRATGEQRNFKAGQMIGAVLEYAQRKNKQLIVYVISDGSLSSSSMVDNSVNGRGKLAWQGDNQSVSSTFFLVYNPGGRAPLVNGAASQQIGWFTADGSVDTTSSPAANSVMQIPEVVILNYLALQGRAGSFSQLFPMQGLGSLTSQQALTAFAPLPS